jgi:beta-galactosidase
VHVGQHKGGYSRFRFDVTTAWKPGAANLIVVKADNSKPAVGSTTEHVLPLAGDFFQHGGIYRGVQLITANDVGIDLLDMGGPGVYVRYNGTEFTTVGTTATGPQDLGTGNVIVSVKVKVRNQSNARRKLVLATVAEYGMDSSVLPLPPLKSALTEFEMKPNSTKTVEVELRFNDSNRWDGVRNPVQHLITATLIERGVGRAKVGLRELDQVTTKFGIRDINFDPNTGATLNGKPIKLHGVSRHQDRLGKGYALSREDHAEDMKIMQEMGVNAVRHAHYQHADEWADEADKAGMLVWAEVPYVTTPTLSGGEGSAEVFANAEQQMRELIRQNYNHPSIVMWSIGNEVDASALFGIGGGATKPLALLRHLQKVAKEEDPSRPTVFADCCEDVRTPVAGLEGQVQGEKLAGAADMIGYNRYYGWYYPEPLKAAEQLASQMDKFHAKHPTLPISVSEYGAGGAITQHSDNVMSGYINAIGRPQPEEYLSWVHEQSWPVIRDRKFIHGSFVWNMFDFASDLRNEGDAVDINTKGLVTMDRKTRKDAFYYYKAQWSNDDFIHLTGKRYADRAYPVMDVRAYTNQSKAFLQINGSTPTETACPGGICIWKDVALKSGPNQVMVAAGTTDHGMPVQLDDTATFNGPEPAKDGIHLDAGDIAGRLLGTRLFGSDNFVTGGTPAILNQGGFGGRGAPRRNVTAPDPALYDYWREGDAFSYAIPVPDGQWTVTIHSFEPRAKGTEAATMSVSTGGKPALAPFNIAKAAGGALKGLAKSFPVMVQGGVLKLDFAGQGGKAVVAAIEITKEGSR